MMYYIENVRHNQDCCIWWRPEGQGYTRNLDEAWKVGKDKAQQICRSRPSEDVMREAAAMDAMAVRHVPR